MATAKSRTSGLVVVAFGVLALVIAEAPLAAQPTQIYPAGGAQGGPIVIAVLADHYQATTADIDAFNLAARNFFNVGLMHDPTYYEGQAGKFTIKTLFQPWARSPATPQSNYLFAESQTGACR